MVVCVFVLVVPRLHSKLPYMKAIGIEFKDFACFKSQFVHVRPGVNLLVGKNNAGKTALLRALSSLFALPIHGQPRSFSADLGGYLAPGANEILFDLICSVDEGDEVFVEGAPPDLWARATREGFLRWNFRIVVNGRQIEFTHAILTMPRAGLESAPWQAAVIHSSGGGVFVDRVRYPELSHVTRRQVSLRDFATHDGMPDPFRQGMFVNVPLAQFTNVKFVNAHRVVNVRNQLQTVTDLPGDAQNLAPFLMTLQGRDRETFEAIERFVVTVFPEFKHVNLVPRENNQLFIDMTERATDRRIPLDSCGTGVEQILTLATFILTTPKPGLILLDEPHSYLHPSAERFLVQFLAEHPEHAYVISTHSAVLMNSVEPARVTHIAPPGRPFSPSPDNPEYSRILFDLGYRNSDAMFNDQLVLVEGPTDAKLIPLLLEKDGEIEKGRLDRTGFPVLDGAASGASALQNSILRYEKLLSAVGRAEQPRMYMFDGDKKNDLRKVLQGTKSPVTGRQIAAAFLPRMEIENYLLIPEAIRAAIIEELALKNEHRDVQVQEIRDDIDSLMNSGDEHLFPLGRNSGADPFAEVKGSKVLETLYEKHGLYYNKPRSGLLIAKHLSAANQPAISEITVLVRNLFPRQ